MGYGPIWRVVLLFEIRFRFVFVYNIDKGDFVSKQVQLGSGRSMYHLKELENGINIFYPNLSLTALIHP